MAPRLHWFWRSAATLAITVPIGGWWLGQVLQCRAPFFRPTLWLYGLFGGDARLFLPDLTFIAAATLVFVPPLVVLILLVFTATAAMMPHRAVTDDLLTRDTLSPRRARSLLLLARISVLSWIVRATMATVGGSLAILFLWNIDTSLPGMNVFHHPPGDILNRQSAARGCLFLAPFFFWVVCVYSFMTHPWGRYTSATSETLCRNCGQILRGISEPRCPECGERI